MLALAICAVLVLLTVAVHALTTAALAGAVAARGADLAALAAADSARGLAPGAPCEVARETAERNSTELHGCDVAGEHGTEVTVTVSVDAVDHSAASGAWLELPELQVRSTSRAGPPPGEL